MSLPWFFAWLARGFSCRLFSDLQGSPRGGGLMVRLSCCRRRFYDGRTLQGRFVKHETFIGLRGCLHSLCCALLKQTYRQSDPSRDEKICLLLFRDLVMSKFRSTLGEALGDREMACRIPGCKGHWTWTARDQMLAFGEGRTEPPQRMCDDCYAIYKGIEEKEVPCAREGCDNTWTWKPMSQLVHFKSTGSWDPPHRLCSHCRQEADGLSDRQVPCRVPGCDNTWTWRAKDQMLAGAPDKEVRPPRRMCETCYARFKTLQDRQVPCRMDGCGNTWTYRREDQLADLVRGVTEPAPRMCDSCYARFKTLDDREVPCRVDGCDGTWHWPRLPQLQAWLDSGTDEPPQPPQRMCSRCSRIYSQLQDREVACAIPGCQGTWTDRRGAQLARIRRGEDEAPPSRICDDCRALLDELHDVEVPCSTEGCRGTWTWKRGAQLRAIRAAGRRDVTPPHRQCDSCRGFLKSHPAKVIHCRDCGAEIPWSSENQLKVHLGLWKEPVLCGLCVKKETMTAGRDGRSKGMGTGD